MCRSSHSSQQTGHVIRHSIGRLPVAHIISHRQNSSVRHNGVTSPIETMRYGVPQGSVLGPLLFLLYAADVQHITTRHSFRSHYYADDSQLHISCRPDQAQQRVTRERAACCIVDSNLWMRSNCLRINISKTEFLWCATARRIQYVNPEPIHIGDVDIVSSASVRNLGRRHDGWRLLYDDTRQRTSQILFSLYARFDAFGDR